MRIPNFAGFFMMPRKSESADRNIMRIAVQTADAAGFRVAQRHNPQHLVLETLSLNNDKKLKDAFDRQGIQYQYSEENLPPHPMKALSFLEKLASQVGR